VKIQQLLHREPFWYILINTLQPFFEARFGEAYKVELFPRNPGLVALRKRGFQQWFCNPHLNSIVASTVDREVLEFIRRSFAVGPRRWLNWCQQSYTYAATRRGLVPCMFPFALGIQPPLPSPEGVLIMGGNNRIRVLDVRARRAWEVLKAGFNPAFLAREIAVRQSGHAEAVPDLKAYAADGSWFEQEFVDGIALNRLDERRDRAALLAEAAGILLRWIRRAVSSTQAHDYIAEVTARIGEHLRNATVLDEAEKRSVQGWVAQTAGLLEHNLGAGKAELLLATGHGDFQEGNILVGRDRIWLVDWEHASRRQALYDFFVIGLRSRFPCGLAARLVRALRNPADFLHTFDGWDELASTLGPGRLPLLFGVFLLEELEWNLEENSNRVFVMESGAWSLFRREMWPSLECLASVA
jgi:hypothetical protein